MSALLKKASLVEATREFTRLLDWAREHGSFLSFVQGSHLRAGAWWRRAADPGVTGAGVVAFAGPEVVVNLTPPAIHRQNARRLKVTSTSWCRIPLPPLTSPRSRITQYVPLLMRANFAPWK